MTSTVDSGGKTESGNQNSRTSSGPGDDTARVSPFVQVKSIFERSGTVIEEPRQLFTQLDVLVHFDDNQSGWKEMARWLKYEETVEVGDRWSKPHVATASLGALMKLRRALVDEQCATGFSVEPTTKTPYKVADVLIKTIKNGRLASTAVNEAVSQRICDTLTRPHKHKHRSAVKTTPQAESMLKQQQHQQNELRREMSNDATKLSSGSSDDDGDGMNGHGHIGVKQQEKHSKKPLLRRRHGTGKDITAAYHSYPPGVKPDNLESYKDSQTVELEFILETRTVRNFLHNVFVYKEPSLSNTLVPNKQLAKKLPKACEAANILIGQCDFLTDTVMAFCRLDNAVLQADLTEVEVPTRFAFVLLGPTASTSIWEFMEIGRAMAALLNDKVFCEVAYQSTHTDDLVAGMDEFMDDLTVLPPSIWDRSVPLEPPGKTMSMDKIKRRLSETKRGFGAPEYPAQEEGASEDHTLERTGRFFGGLIRDVRHRYRLYWSDIKDGFHVQCLASIIFLFFACITPIVTFGGLMGQKTDGLMGTMEMLLAGAICGIGYAAFAGQPLTIIGATGPLLVFESIIYHMCKENGLDFMSFRFWIGMWVFVALMIIVAFDLSALVRYITRFTEESFAILISVIFIVEAFSKIFEIWDYSPVDVGTSRRGPDFFCVCSPPNSSTSDWSPFDVSDMPQSSWNSTTPWSDADANDTIGDWPAATLKEVCSTNKSRLIVRHGCVSEKDCLSRNWTLEGAACGIHTATGGVPDVFLLSFILFIGTFAVAMFFRSIRGGRFFPALMKSTLADFAVLLAVVTCTGVDFAFGLNTPKLNVPGEFKPTRADRSWIVNPGAVTFIWLIPVAAIPAILGTILIFLDQQITAVIVNRKEHKLVKGHGYHLDLLVIAVLIVICSVLGLPWFVAATVRSVSHVRSLIRQSDVRAPGEQPQMLGVREQRFTGICIHLLIGFSTLITVVLRLIPMPVLYGVFLYMGITSLSGVQFIQRLAILLMPIKYQPDYIFLRHVKAIRVHAFTGIQVICSILMWVIKSVKATSIAFPVMLIALMAVRKLLDFVFTQSDLYWLDHLLPDELRRAKEDNANVSEEQNNNHEKEVIAISDSRKSSRSFTVEVGDQDTKTVSTGGLVHRR